MGEVVSMVEGPEETWLDCVRGAAAGGATVAGGGCVVGGGESGFRGATLKPGPNVKGDCVFEVESPRDVSPLLLGGLCVDVDVDVEGPADMILRAVSRRGDSEGRKLVNHCTQPAHNNKT